MREVFTNKFTKLYKKKDEKEFLFSNEKKE
jgi:hypothetical protein